MVRHHAQCPYTRTILWHAHMASFHMRHTTAHAHNVSIRILHGVRHASPCSMVNAMYCCITLCLSYFVMFHHMDNVGCSDTFNLLIKVNPLVYGWPHIMLHRYAHVMTRCVHHVTACIPRHQHIDALVHRYTTLVHVHLRPLHRYTILLHTHTR
jgi:hypothetical protein